MSESMTWDGEIDQGAIDREQRICKLERLLDEARAEIGRLKRRRFDIGSMPEEWPQCTHRYPYASGATERARNLPAHHHERCILIAGHSGPHDSEGWGQGWDDSESWVDPSASLTPG